MSRADTSPAAPAAATAAGSIVPDGGPDDGFPSGPGEADLSAAIDRLFPPMCSAPASADAIAQHGAAMARLGPSPAAVTDAAAMHGQALALNPGLAALFRTKECADDVASLATVHDRAPAAVEEARRRYARMISESLGTEAPAARDVLDALDALQREQAAAAARAAEEAATAQAAEQERKAAARAARAAGKATVAAAAQAEQTAHAAYVAAAREHARLRAELLAERVQALGLTEIRDHLGRLWNVRELLHVNDDGTAALPPAHELHVLERALDKHERELEAP